MAHRMPQMRGVDHSWFRVGDIDFHVASAGPEEEVPVLLVHGWPQHWYCWRLVIPELAETRRVLALDLRGFGWTSIAWEGFERETMAADVLAVLDRMGVEKVDLMGHDWGAWIGYILALRHPERIRRLIGLSAPPPFAPPRPRALLRLWRLSYQLGLAAPVLGPRLGGRPDVIKKTIRKGAARRGNLGGRVLKLYGRDLKASTRARASSLLYRAFLTRDLLPVLAGRYRRLRLRVPTLVMHGRRDPAVYPALFEGHERFADDLTVEELKGVGHFLPEECPQPVARRALEFFGSGDQRQPAPAQSRSRESSASSSSRTSA